MLTDPHVQQATHRYRLVMTTVPSRLQSGDLLGRGAGSSLEFQEYREYAPGDDVRHLDWAAYARSDSLMIRLHREEISPTLEVLLDASRSMTTSASKTLVAKQLAAALILWTSQAGGSGFVEVVGDNDIGMRLPVDELPQLEALAFDGVRPLTEAFAGGRLGAKKQAVRIVISDFLFDGNPEPVIRAASQSAGSLWVIQLLSRFEADPSMLGGRRLVDVESLGEADIILNQPTIAEYKRRLAGLQNVLTESCRRVHARFLTLIADDGLPAICRDSLCGAGLIEPA